MKKTEERSENEHDCFSIFRHSDFGAVSASRSAKCSLLKFRSLLPQLKPRTGTWSHRSLIVLGWFFGSSFTSSGIYIFRTSALIRAPRRSNSSSNLRISSLRSRSHMCVGVRAQEYRRHSPK